MSRLRDIREARGISREKLGVLSGTSSRTIARAESGEEIKLNTLRAIAAALGVPVADLIDEDAA